MYDADIVDQVRAGDSEAYSLLVERYQNVVYGLAYHHLQNFEDARDVAQEAFVQAYLRLGQLREPAKFASWLRQLTINQCHMWQRRQRIAEPLDEAITTPHQIEQTETRLVVQEALECLSAASRLTLTLFYMHAYSLQEIAMFLEVPVTTVKSRLRNARARLRKELMQMVEETLKQESLPEQFAAEVVQRVLDAAYEGNAEELENLLRDNAALANAKGPHEPTSDDATYPLLVAAHSRQNRVAELLLKQGADIHAASDGWNAMHIAAFLNNREMVDLFIAHGARPDIFAAAALGDSDCVRALLQKSPALVHQKGPDGATPLHVAGTVEVARLLLEAGANIEALDDFYHNTPAEYNSNNREVVRFLISQGANVKFHLACWIGDAHRVQRFLQEQPELAHMRKGNDRPEGESLPVTIAAIAGEAEIVGLLLDHGVDSSTYDEVRGATPLHFAALWGHLDTARVLVERGANVSAPAYNGSTPLAWAIRGEQEGWGKFNRDPDPPRHQEIIQLLRQHSAGE